MNEDALTKALAAATEAAADSQQRRQRAVGRPAEPGVRDGAVPDDRPGQLGQQAHLGVGDVADPQVPGRMVDEIVERFGRLDVFVYSIGIRPHGTILDLTPEEWQRVMDVNLNGAFYASQAAARAMVKAGHGGSIINVTGSAAAQGKKGRPHVVASKTGLLGYTRALAAELGEYGIRANSIAPVNLQDTSRPQEWYPTPIPTTVNKASPVPLGRHGTTDDIVEVMLFLASDASRYMTGQALNVNGGVYMQ